MEGIHTIVIVRFKKMKIESDKYMDGYLKSNLDKLTEAVNLNWDGLLYIAGYEGDGKSTLAAQIVYYFDRTITLDRVCFTAKQFLEACLKAKNKQAILFDESYLTFSNRSLFNEMSRTLTSMLTMIRKKQLFIIIVAPTFFDIQKYIAIHRARALIYVYAKGLQRGFFGFYNRMRKHELYIKGKRDHNMYVVNPNFKGRFTKWFPFNSEEYDVKKESAIQELTAMINKSKEIKPEEMIEKDKLHQEAVLLAWLRSHKQLKVGALTYTASNYYDLSVNGLCNRLERVSSLTHAAHSNTDLKTKGDKE